MKVYFVGAGPGDPELLTVRAHRLLTESRVCIYAGSLINPAVMELLPATSARYDSAGMSLPEIVDVCAGANRAGIDVVRLHSGDPSIYGAIREQMNELDRLVIDYEVVPGVSSFQAAAAVLKTELTVPEAAQSIILTRAAGRTPVPPEQDLSLLARTRSTLCIFLSVGQIREVAETLARELDGSCPAAVVYRATWPDQAVVRGTLADIARKTEAAAIGKTAMIVVGRALSREAPVSKLYAPAFSHGFRDGEKA
ncbi:MAG: precorrin-4 C(11)-methyltransferase [Deltaproteobacteria bacterium]|uniref:precorrin-4 C(11)-methyltransferase n=1 Tax=Candidatus Deferrimicrobium sp. TaxID=3060586 RepID=UPI002727FF67|nr:precorrin-4 C(11)-methyltransferase [Candidatus Deferrimicrobium sp.]MCR4309545.1 precorrin-4 C(11)-methyltransferase [Deltaproteobacteria bacterium]MDO8739725.1 precorrin-4 C(11)-methyltransferase [Candidatus Deferrimicrobium sp.]